MTQNVLARIGRLAQDRAGLAVAANNLRMMHFLRRLARRFNEAKIPLMVLKGAAMHLTVYNRPDARRMCDLDLLVRESDMARAVTLIQGMGGYRSQILLREDFFPKFYYEVEYTAGQISPVVMDVHVRPFRPLRYAKLVPDDAMWADARKVFMGDAFVYVPSPERMLIHLVVHYAIHGQAGRRWSEDIRKWVTAFETEIDWDACLALCDQWRLSLAMWTGLQSVQARYAQKVVPEEILNRLKKQRINWRDRLCLKQAPRDNEHPMTHVLVNCLTTPDLGFVLRYLYAAILPGRQHMREWYAYDHRGWLAASHLCRWFGPVTRRLAPMFTLFNKTQLIRDPASGWCLIAKRTLEANQLIGCYKIQPWNGQKAFSVIHQYDDGTRQPFTMRGKMRFVGISPTPNARFEGYRLIAIKRICPGDPICVAPTQQTNLARHPENQKPPPTPQKVA